MANIVFDLDGVLVNFHYSFSIISNKLFGTPIVKDINQVKAYRWEDWGYQLNKEQHNKVWKCIDKNVEEFWYNMEPLVDDSICDRIKELEKIHSLFFVTSRRNTAGRNVVAQTNDWIRKNIGLINFSVIPSEKKGKIIDGINADYFIEDSVENLLEVFHQAPKCKLFLLIRPYNNFALEFLTKSHKYRKINIVYSIETFLDDIK